LDHCAPVGTDVPICIYHLPCMLLILSFSARAPADADVAVLEIKNALLLQASILKEGAVPALVRVLDGGPVSAGTAASVWALMEICMKNPAGQQELLEHQGLAKVHPLPEPPVKLMMTPNAIQGHHWSVGCRAGL
jgi:hypothetical protein